MMMMIARVLSPFSFPSLFTSSSRTAFKKRTRERETNDISSETTKNDDEKRKQQNKSNSHITVPTVGAIPNTVTSNHPPPIFFEIALKASRPKEPMISTLFEEMP